MEAGNARRRPARRAPSSRRISARCASRGSAKPTGLLTGYYEPIVEGSRFPSPEFYGAALPPPARLWSPPATSRQSSALSQQGRAIGRRDAEAASSCPIYDRGAIEDGALDGQHLEICWLKDPLDAFFDPDPGLGARAARGRHAAAAQLRLAQRLFLYARSGALLIERKLVPREEMSMERIRAVDGGAIRTRRKELRQHNRSYVFFRITGLDRRRGAGRRAGRPADAGPLDRGRPRCTSTARRSSSRPTCRSTSEAGDAGSAA